MKCKVIALATTIAVSSNAWSADNQNSFSLKGLSDAISRFVTPSAKDDGELEKVLANKIRSANTIKELKTAYEDALYDHLNQVEVVTRIFLKEKPDSAADFFEVLKTTSESTYFEVRARATYDLVYDQITEDIKTNKLDLKALFKKYEGHITLLTVRLLALDKRQTDTRFEDELFAEYQDSFGSGFPVAALGLLAFAGGGGGGSGDNTCYGGPCNPVYSKAAFEGAQYTNQYGLGLINASGLYQYGKYGSGVVVAVFDSGIRATHESFTGGRIASGGYDYVDNNAYVVHDPNGHGTHVSGIIAGNRNPASGLGMHGVAFEAGIMPFRISNAAGAVVVSDATLASGLDRARTNGARILNHSWGSVTTITQTNQAAISAALPNTLSAAQTAVNNDSVYVWAAGNNGAYALSTTDPAYRAGLPHYFPNLKPGWVAVAAVDAAGTIASYSNRCGVASSWCISAPGSVIYSSGHLADNAYVNASGTSMAAPHVSGAIAALKSRFPNLSYQLIKDRIFATANKSGIYSNTAVYGQGLLDLEAAASPVGVLVIPQGASTASGSTMLAGASLLAPTAALPSDFPKALLVLDSFQSAPFMVASNSFMTGYGFNIKTPSLVQVQSGKAALGNNTSLSYSNDHMLLITQRGEDGGQFGFGRLRELRGNHFDWSSNLANGEDKGTLAMYRRPSGTTKLWLGAWNSTNTRSSHRTYVSAEEISALPVSTDGLLFAASKKVQPNTEVQFGFSASKPKIGASLFGGTGAFTLQQNQLTSAWVQAKHLFSFVNGTSTESAVTLTNWNVGQTSGSPLVKPLSSLNVRDLSISLEVTPGNQNGKFTVMLGRSFGSGGDVEVSVPTSINSQGQIGYSQSLLTPAHAFNETRGSIGFSKAWRKGINGDLFYGFKHVNSQALSFFGGRLTIAIR